MPDPIKSSPQQDTIITPYKAQQGKVVDAFMLDAQKVLGEKLQEALNGKGSEKNEIKLFDILDKQDPAPLKLPNDGLIHERADNPSGHEWTY